MAKPKVCTYCAADLDAEQAANPRRDEGGAVMCDECYGQHYEDNCSRCGEIFEKKELSPKPGRIIGVWRDAPALLGHIDAGYYRVLSWPIYADGMIEGYFFSRALSRVGPLDVSGLRAAEREQAMAGPMCKCCQRAALRAARLIQCFVGEVASTRGLDK